MNDEEYTDFILCNYKAYYTDKNGKKIEVENISKSPILENAQVTTYRNN